MDVADDETKETAAAAKDEAIEEDDDEEEEKAETMEDEFDVETPMKENKPKKLTALQHAMGEQLIYSSKSRSELEDWAWNRQVSTVTMRFGRLNKFQEVFSYNFNDDNLPSWFAEEEAKHKRRDVPVDPVRKRALLFGNQS